jgi:hypothetical protein
MIKQLSGLQNGDNSFLFIIIGVPEDQCIKPIQIVVLLARMGIRVTCDIRISFMLCIFF